MANDAIPTIRIELEGVKQQIISMLTDRNNEIKSIIELELNNMDIESIVKYIVQTKTPKLIEDVITRSLDEIVSWEFQQAIKEPIANAITNAITNVMKDIIKD